MDFISLGDKNLGGERRIFSRKPDGLWLEAQVEDGRVNCVNIPALKTACEEILTHF